MTQDYIRGWVNGAEDGMREFPNKSILSGIDSDYLRGYKEGYRIGKGFRNGMANAR